MSFFLVASFGLLVSLFANLSQLVFIRRYGREAGRRGITGGEIARGLLDAAGLPQVVVDSSGSRKAGTESGEVKKLLLPRHIYQGQTLRGAAQAAHEVAAALKASSNLVALRTALNVIRTTSCAAWVLLIAGWLLNLHFLGALAALFYVSAFVGAICWVPAEWETSEFAYEILKKQSFFEIDELAKLKNILLGIRLEGLALVLKGPASLAREKMKGSHGV